MKVTVVPAQVTTIEDRIMGNLSLSQLMILLLPVFIGGSLFVALPPAMGSSFYKYLLIGLISLVCIVLSIRIKGRIVASWIVTILRYNMRPRYYLFNKNVSTLRAEYPNIKIDDVVTAPQANSNKLSLPRLGLNETSKILAAIENPASNLIFETTKKGGLHVRFTEIEK